MPRSSCDSAASRISSPSASDKEYLAGVGHRTAALEDSRLLPLVEAEIPLLSPREANMNAINKVCVVSGASGKLGHYMIRHALERGFGQVVGVCRPESVGKLAEFGPRITIVPGRTDDREVIRRAVEGCDGVLTVLAPWGTTHYATGTAQAVLDYATPGARLAFSCGWHITRDGQDRYTRKLRAIVKVFGFVAHLFRIADLDDQVEALSPNLRQRHALDGCACRQQRSGGGARAKGFRCGVAMSAIRSSRANRTRRITFALFHGCGAGGRLPRARGAGDRRPEDRLGAGSRCCRLIQPLCSWPSPFLRERPSLRERRRCVSDDRIGAGRSNGDRGRRHERLLEQQPGRHHRDGGKAVARPGGRS